MTIDEFGKWLTETQGYDFDGDELWMEDYLSEHKWRDIYDLFMNFIENKESR